MVIFSCKGNEFEVYEEFAKEQMESTSKMYRHLGIGGKLYELLARPKVAEYFRVRQPSMLCCRLTLYASNDATQVSHIHPKLVQPRDYFKVQ